VYKERRRRAKAKNILCKMSIKSILRTSEKLHSISSIALLFIITLSIDHCDCDQGKKDTFLPSQIDIFLHSSIHVHLAYCSPLLIVVVGCSFYFVFSCMWIKRDEREEEDGTKKNTLKYLRVSFRGSLAEMM
jgi:hypothetical protein